MGATDYFGYDFEGGYLLFADEFTPEPGVYVIYTLKNCLDIGQAVNIKDAIETHPRTRDWVRLAGKDEIFVSVYPESDESSRQEIEKYLRGKMNPLCPKP